MNSGMINSVIWFTLAESKSSEHLPQPLGGAFTGDKLAANGSPGSLGSVVADSLPRLGENKQPPFSFLIHGFNHG